MMTPPPPFGVNEKKLQNIFTVKSRSFKFPLYMGGESMLLGHWSRGKKLPQPLAYSQADKLE